MDHYNALGVNNNASKEEIKKAFRKLALEFHPDKHSRSSKQLRESAAHKFKVISEAYETLIDDVKRADYNNRRDPYNRHNPHYRGNTGYSYSSSSKSYAYGYNGSARKTASGGVDAIFTKIEIGLRFVTTKAFLLNATLSCVVLGAVVLLDASGPTLWKMQNPGKSFEDAMEALQKSKDNHS